jgi:hypothetical protein
VSKALADGTLHWFAVWKERIQDAWTNIESFEGFEEDTDADGEITIELDRAPPLLSVWVFVLPESRSILVWTPPDYPLRAIETELNQTLARFRPGRRNLEVPGKNIEWTLFRPDKGVWRGKVYDGTEEDEDGKPDGRTRIALDRLVGVERALGPPPEVLTPGDLLIGVDVRTMRFLVAGVAP